MLKKGLSLIRKVFYKVKNSLRVARMSRTSAFILLGVCVVLAMFGLMRAESEKRDASPPREWVVELRMPQVHHRSDDMHYCYAVPITSPEQSTATISEKFLSPSLFLF